jgi:diguanylate cyclase (GGDEF)-like protein
MLNSIDAAQCRQLLQACPIGMMLLDKKGVVRWINPALETWLGKRAKLIADQPADGIPAELQGLYGDNPTVHLTADKATDEHWLIGTTQPLPDGGRVQFFTNASPLKQLMQQRDDLLAELKELTVTDAESGLPNRRALFQNLESQVSRSRRYQNPLSIILMRIQNMEDAINRTANRDSEPLMSAIRTILNDQMRWADMIGRLDETDFLFILPETDLSATRQLTEKISANFDDIAIEGLDPGDFSIISRYGIAEWRKGDDVGLLLMRAREDLEGGARSAEQAG